MATRGELLYHSYRRILHCLTCAGPCRLIDPAYAVLRGWG
jgi:hypothetical protein